MSAPLNSKERSPQNSHPTVGVLFAGPRFLIDRQFWAGAVEGASRRGLNTIAIGGGMLGDTRGFAATGNALFEIIDSQPFDAIVAWAGEMAVFTGGPLLQSFLGRFTNIPLVSAAYHFPGIPCVIGDNAGGIRKMLRHLILDHGAQRVAFVRGPAGHPEADARYSAYLTTLAECGLESDPALICAGYFDEATGARAITSLLDHRNIQFDAILCANDPIALGVIKELRKRGIRVPADILVAGFDDRADAPCSDPPLSTVRYSFARMAELCIDKVADLLEGRMVNEVSLLDTELVIRRSCSCLPERIRIALEPDFCLQRSLGPADATWKARATKTFLRQSVLPDDDKQAVSGLDDFLQAFEEPYQNEAKAGPRSSNELRQDFISLLIQNIATGRALDGILEEFPNTILNNAHFRRTAVAARLTAADMATRHFERSILEIETSNELLSDTMEQTGVTLGLDELREALVQGLPGLGIHDFALSLYCGPAAALRSRCRLLVAWNHDKPLPLENFEYDSSLLAPADFFPMCRYDLMVVPLYFREEALGIALVGTEPANSRICEILRSQLSRAIKASLLLEEREKARQQVSVARATAEEANRQKSRFLAGMSHELRTPLNSIINFAYLLRSGSDGPLEEGQQDLLARIEKSGEYLLGLINDILDLAKIESGKLELQLEALDLRPLLAELADTAQSLVQGRPVRILIETASELPLLQADRTRIRQILLNLISNAAKYTDEGFIRIRAEAVPETMPEAAPGAVPLAVLISVEDSGVGMDPLRVSQAFAEFEQVGSPAEQRPGTGLGLPIARRFAELHGGRIDVQTAPGKGSCFTLRLPLKPQHRH